MKCEYCLTENETSDYCKSCGAKLPVTKKEDWKSGPFFYNGYICYSIINYEKDSMEVQFWLGQELVERIELSFDIIESRFREGYSMMPFFWELFLVAHGEKEVLEWTEKNKKYPARFEVRRIENEEKEYLMSLDRNSLVKEFMNNG